jgi:hypothetical protein
LNFDHLTINPRHKWIVSTQASILYGVGAVLSCVLTAFSFDLLKFPDADKVSVLGRIFWGIYGVATAFGIILLWVGMRKYQERREWEQGRKSRWLRIALFIGFWWSATIYYLLVYLPTRNRSVKIES